MTVRRVTGVVLAAGASRRLGQPKQLLPYRDSTLLGQTLTTALTMARSCRFDQLIVTLGGAAAAVQDTVPLDGLDIVVAEVSESGCSASLRAALERVHPDTDGIVLLLGDQPGVTVAAVRALLGHADHPIAVCRYADGIGHPFWLSRTVFADLSLLHGDKAVWKLIEDGRFRVAEVPVAGPVPLDVDTWDDYQRLLAAVAP
ncbi:carbon monoxide dehydrogenase [Mycolicibacterium litorale]|nr:carbon monoxide dehydrogenase [Mycolicibacterium litorale]